MSAFLQILFIGLSYLIGAVPFGLIFTRIFSGVDVRSVGSGNIGATNVLRASGKKAAILTLLADGVKGFFPVLLVRLQFHDDVTTALCGMAAILGHNFPVYLKFRGGKGVATSFGVVLAVAPWIGLFTLFAWLAAAALWRYSSLAALIAFTGYALMTFFVFPPEAKSYLALSLFISGMIYFRHRENIKRLLIGAEPKIGEQKK